MLRETRADILALPGILAVFLLAAILRVAFASSPSVSAIVVCAVLVGLDALLAWYVLRTGAATFVVTADDITFTPRPGTGRTRPPPQVIRRSPGGTLSFHLKDGGNVAGQQAFYLHLRGNATGQEISATTFGRRKVRRACESQGWHFS